jgi:hypothetical protein
VSRKGKIIIPQARSGSIIPTPIAEVQKSTIHNKVVFSFELFDQDHECPSTWSDEIRGLFLMFKKASGTTWNDVFKSGGRPGNKVGLGYTIFSNPPFARPQILSQDISISEMRVGRKGRVFGAHKLGIYYVIRLDKNHEICAE